MAKVVASGKNVVFKLTTSEEKILSEWVTKISGNFKGHSLIDVTTMGAAGHQWAPDELEDNSFTVDFMWDKASDGPYDVLKTFSRYGISDGAHAFEIGPEGETATYPKITGTCWMEGDLPIEMPIGDMIKITGVAFKVEEDVTFDEYT